MTPAVTINATVRAGGVHEPSDRTGLAYLAGRVLDRGTEHRTADQLAEELDERGVSLRIASSRHATILSCTCLSEDFDDVLALVLDVVRAPVFPEAEVAKRKAECLSGDPSGRGQSVGPRRRDALRDAVRRLASVRAEGQGHDRDRRGHRARRPGVVPRRTVHAGGVVAGDRRPRRRRARAHARVTRARWLDGGVAGDGRASGAAPRARARAACNRPSGEVPVRDRLRLHCDSPSRSALRRVFRAEQHLRSVRSRWPPGGEHPRTPGHGVLRLQLARSERRRRAAHRARRRRSRQRRASARSHRSRSARDGHVGADGAWSWPRRSSS